MSYGWWRERPLEEQVRLLEHFAERERHRSVVASAKLAAISAALVPQRSRDLPSDEFWSAYADHPAIHVLIKGLLDVASAFTNDIHKSSPPVDDDTPDGWRHKAQFWFRAAERYAEGANAAWWLACERYCQRTVDPDGHHHGDGGCVFLPAPTTPLQSGDGA